VCSVFALALLALILAAMPAPAADQPSDVVTLRLWGGDWGIPAKDSTDPWRRAQRQVFEAFAKSHPKIQVVSSSGLQVQGPAAESGLLMAMAGGTAPDVFYVNFRKLHNYINQGFLYPMDEYIKKDPQILRKVHPQIRKVITVDGHVYSLPWFQAVMAMYYRKDMYRAAGLDPNKPPQTWDEFYEYCKKLTIPEKGQYGFGFASTPSGTSFHWINFLWQAGGDVVAQNDKGEWHCVFNSPAGVKALEFFRKLVVDDWIRPSDGKHFKGVASHTTSWATDITQDKIAQWFNYSSDMVTNKQGGLNPSLLGIAALPAGPAGRANEINAGMWGINATIKDKRVRDAAWEYIKFMSSDEADRIRTKAYIEAGLGKMVTPDKLQRYGYTEYLRGIPKGWIEANVEAFKHGHPEPHGKNCEMIYIELDQPLNEIELYPNRDPKEILDRAARRIDTKMLGFVEPKVMAHRRKVAWGTFVFLFLLIGSAATVSVRGLAKAHTEGTEDTQVVRGRGNKMVHVIAWLFMAPAVLSILIWAYYPLAKGMLMAFQNYRILGGGQFIGFDNFIEAACSETFRKAVVNTLTYVTMNICLGFCVPIILALLLNEVPRCKMLFRTLFYLPAVTSSLVIIFLWKWFYDPSPQGLFNTLIGYYDNMATSLAQHIPAMAHLQISQQTWLSDPKLAMLCIILPAIWAGAGPGSIIYLAAMKGIPEDMYEAADLDGAGIWHKIRQVTIPTLSPLIIINFVGVFIGSFKAMENIFVMTGGGPLNATHTVSLEIWYNAFMYLKFGYATAAAWIMGSMLIGFTMYQLRILKNVKFSTSGREE
jgi:ABC-type sugar transport system permease subunit/ABC-type glycerol-3-phosphate transport system substrate-binding protein